MKNRLSRGNNGFIGNNNSLKSISDGIVNLNKKNNTIAENYYVSDSNMISYAPPSEWRQLPSFAGVTQGFAGVFAIYDNDTNFVTLQMNTSTGNYIVDWGDGTTGSFADNAIAYKNYSKSVYAGLTSSVYKNYKTLVIQAYPVSGTILEMTLTNGHNQSGFQSSYQYPWLNIQAVGSSCTNFNFSNNFLIEQINFIGLNNITSNVTRFSGMRSLKKVINWDTSKCTSFHQMFRTCVSLIECPPINTSSVSVGSNNFTYMFENCTSLRYVPLFDTSKATSFENMFAACTSLSTIPPFNTSNVTNLSGTFFFCFSIEELPWLDTSKVTNFSSGIRGCVKLKKFPNWNFSNGTNISYPFGSLNNVIEVTNLDTSSGTDLFELFARDYVLQKVNTLNISKATRFDSAFYECGSLQSIPNLIRDGNTVCSMSYMSWNNGQVSTVPNFNTNRISTWLEAFVNNYSITSVGFTFNYPIGQTWATASVFNSTFSNCRSLRTIGLSDVSGISGSTYTNAYSGMFNTCLSLSEVGLSGISENFSIQNCSLGATALNDLYTRLAVVGASGAGAKTITVSGNWGAASDNPAIAIAKGWSVSG
jgi:surface protein